MNIFKDRGLFYTSYRDWIYKATRILTNEGISVMQYFFINPYHPFMQQMIVPFSDFSNNIPLYTTLMNNMHNIYLPLPFLQQTFI